MSGIILPPKAPRCPLCYDNANAKEHVMVEKFEPARGFNIYCCDRYHVACRVDDPHVGQWEKAAEKVGRIECPACNANMRIFTTSVGFMKAVCPKKSCGATLHNGTRRDDRTAFDMPETTPDNPGLLQ